MVRKLLLVLVVPVCGMAQSVSIDTQTYTPEQLVSNVMVSAACGAVSNVTYQGASGIAYFNNNGGSFPFTNGIIIRSGNAALSGGPFNDANNSSNGSGMPDDSSMGYPSPDGQDLHGVAISGGQTGGINDVSSIRFEFVPQASSISFNYIFASNEYGQYQCTFGDVFAFLLKDLDTGVITNLAVVPGTTTPVTVVSIRNSAYNNGCASVNPQYFGSYNLGNPSAPISFRGQTVPMTASANVVPGHHYALKFAVGDYEDSIFDSAVFIDGGSLSLSNQCADHLLLNAFVDTNTDGSWNNGEIPFSHGNFVYETNGSGVPVSLYAPLGQARLYPENASDTYHLAYQVDPLYQPYYSASAVYDGVTVVPGETPYDFAVSNLGSYNNLSVGLTPLTLAKAGSDWLNRVTLTNNGTAAVSGNISFSGDGALVIASVSDASANISASGFNMPFTDLPPGQSRTIDVALHVPELPAVTLGQNLYNTVNVDGVADDIDLSDNSASEWLQVVASYDPNFMSEAHGGLVSVADFDDSDYLDYTIHFQNTGTAYAAQVRVGETLDEKLDETSIRMVDASHNYVLSRSGNALLWTMDNLSLAPQSVSENDSQGFVHFRIKPKPGYAAGDIVDSFASIYFDGNPAILTNNAVVEFVAQLGTASNVPGMFTIFPNPSSAGVSVSGPETIRQITFTDVLGHRMLTVAPMATQASIPVSGLAAGIYVMEIRTEKATEMHKLIVK